jgi:hypothetical protein
MPGFGDLQRAGMVAARIGARPRQPDMRVMKSCSAANAAVAERPKFTAKSDQRPQRPSFELSVSSQTDD